MFLNNIWKCMKCHHHCYNNITLLYSKKIFRFTTHWKLEKKIINVLLSHINNSHFILFFSKCNSQLYCAVWLDLSNQNEQKGKTICTCFYFSFKLLASKNLCLKQLCKIKLIFMYNRYTARPSNLWNPKRLRSSKI